MWTFSNIPRNEKFKFDGKCRLIRHETSIALYIILPLVPVKSKVEILQNFVAFSEYMNFKSLVTLSFVPFWLVWAEIKCTMYFNLSKRPINQFEPVLQSIQQVPIIHCFNIMIYCDSPLLWLTEKEMCQIKKIRVEICPYYRLNHVWLWPWSWNFQCCQALLLIKNILVELSVLDKVKTLK